MPVFTRPLLDVTGCDIPSLDLSAAEKAIMELVGSEDGGFQNPIEDAMSSVQGSIGDALAGINTSVGVTFTDADGNPVIDPETLEPITTFGYLSQQLGNLNGGVDKFRIHSDRLSGVSIADAFGSDTYGPGGIQGEYPGLGGLHSVASQFNTLKETLRDPAQAAEDHYSPIFNSLFGPGDDMMRSIQSLVDGDVANFMTNFPAGGNDSLAELASLGANIQDFQASLVALENDDNLQFEFALDFIAKQTTGLSVLSMLDEPCFGTRLLDKIGSPDFKSIAGL